MWIATRRHAGPDPLVLTNDLHQLVFRFQPGFRNWDSDYLHTAAPFMQFTAGSRWKFIGVIGILFSPLPRLGQPKLVWVPLLRAVRDHLSDLVRSRRLDPRERAAVWRVPVRPSASAWPGSGLASCISDSSLIHLQHRATDDSLMHFIVFLFCALALAVAFFRFFLACSALAAQIADRDYRVIYRNPNAAPLSLQQAPLPTRSSRWTANTRIPSQGDPRGYVYWQDEVTALNRINEALWEVGERSARRRRWTRLENEIKVERAQIGGEVADLRRDREKRPATVPADQRAVRDGRERPPNAICRAHENGHGLLAVYIKRYANLSCSRRSAPRPRRTSCISPCRSPCGRWRRWASRRAAPATRRTAVPAKSALGPTRCLSPAWSARPTLRGGQVSIRTDALHCVFEGAAPELPARCAAALTLEDGNAYLRVPLREAGDAV